MATVASVKCYRNDELIESIVDCAAVFVTQEHHWFQFAQKDQGMSLYELSDELRPFVFRYYCIKNLENFYTDFARMYPLVSKRYPAPEIWCDDNLELNFLEIPRRYKDVNDINLLKRFICPGAGEGKCHYAMNPNCKPDSPDDMVLLFESKAGWNQHGGLELFTFDNHDPKGGCVLLNDGSVKFIRTEEELDSLRWK